MSDLNDLSRPVTTDTEPNVLDTLRAHIARAATWAWGATANKVAGLMSATTATVSGGRSLRLYRRNDANTADEEVVSLPAVSVGGNAATASAAQSGSALEAALASKAPLNSPNLTGAPTTPTAAAGTSTTQVASTAFAVGEVAGLRGSAPAALNTLEKLATALGGDANFAGNTNSALANRIVKKSSARPGVDRVYRNDSDSDYSGQLTWSIDRSGYWSFRGYAGDTYHAPVFVGYAGYADSAGAVSWGNVSGKPTTVAGYGITDMGSQVVSYASSAGAVAWTGLTGKPTTVAGYGITDMGSQSVSYASTAGSASSVPWSGVDGKPTTVAGYGITDMGSQSVSYAATAGALSGQSGSAPVFAARAWVNFNGLGAVGASQVIRGSGNVSSVMKHAGGQYTVNFAAAMPDANYCVAGLVQRSVTDANTYNNGVAALQNGYAPTASSFRARVQEPSSNNWVDCECVSFVVFR